MAEKRNPEHFCTVKDILLHQQQFTPAQRDEQPCSFARFVIELEKKKKKCCKSWKDGDRCGKCPKR